MPKEHFNEILCLYAYEFSRSPLLNNYNSVFWPKFTEILTTKSKELQMSLNLENYSQLSFAMSQRKMFDHLLWDSIIVGSNRALSQSSLDPADI
jgi:hypothetical protein